MSKSAANSKADTAVKLVLIFFISLLSFSVGTYVGKQVSDSDARRAALEADYSGNSEQVATQDTHTSEEDTAPLSSEEEASLTEEFVQNARNVASAETATATETEHTANTDTTNTETTNSTHTNAETAAPAATDGYTLRTKASTTPVSAAAERVANDKAPTPDAKKVREAPTVLPSVATTAIGKYTVQVASFATESEAKDQAAKLTEKGYSAFYVSANVGGKSWYRVSVGLFSDQKSATNYRTELLATQAVSSAIVQKIVK